MKAHVPDAEIVTVLKAYEVHKTHRKTGLALGISQTTVHNYIEYAKQRGLTADTPVMDRASKLEIENKKLQADLKALQRDADTADKIRQEIFAMAARSPEPPAWLKAVVRNQGARGTPMTLWSDWHYGEVVRPEEVGGVNEFNSDICAARAKRLVDTIIDLCFNHMGRSTTKYPGIVIGLNGDLITGDIHAELTETNDRTPQQQINDLTDILASCIEEVASKFGNVFVPCEPGNHGRDTMKPRMKGRVYTSHEWVIYTNLERYFRKDKRVIIHVPPETDAYFKVYGHRYLMTHGDSLGVKGGDGMIGALGPIMRGAIKTGRSEAHVGRDFDTLLLGHWHQMLWLPNVIVNNALKGFDEFARLALRAPYSRPSQALWFTHPEHGITARWEVFLEGQKQAQDANEWLTYQKGIGAK